VDTLRHPEKVGFRNRTAYDTPSRTWSTKSPRSANTLVGMMVVPGPPHTPSAGKHTREGPGPRSVPDAVIHPGATTSRALASTTTPGNRKASTSTATGVSGPCTRVTRVLGDDRAVPTLLAPLGPSNTMYPRMGTVGPVIPRYQGPWGLTEGGVEADTDPLGLAEELQLRDGVVVRDRDPELVTLVLMEALELGRGVPILLMAMVGMRRNIRSPLPRVPRSSPPFTWGVYSALTKSLVATTPDNGDFQPYELAGARDAHCATNTTIR